MNKKVNKPASIFLNFSSNLRHLFQKKKPIYLSSSSFVTSFHIIIVSENGTEQDRAG